MRGFCAAQKAPFRHGGLPLFFCGGRRLQGFLCTACARGKREEQQLTPGGYMSKPPLSPAALACSALGMAVFKIKAMFSRISSLL